MVRAERADTKPGWRQRQKAESQLDDARTQLPEIRKGFINATLLWIAAELSEDPAQYRPLYFSVFNSFLRAQEKIAIEKVFIPKVILGQPIYHRRIEEKAKREGGDFAQSKGLPREFGIGVVWGHVGITKRIQREQKKKLGIWTKAMRERQKTKKTADKPKKAA